LLHGVGTIVQSKVGLLQLAIDRLASRFSFWASGSTATGYQDGYILPYQQAFVYPQILSKQAICCTGVWNLEIIPLHLELKHT
jgi:hypothetical protein